MKIREWAEKFFVLEGKAEKINKIIRIQDVRYEHSEREYFSEKKFHERYIKFVYGFTSTIHDAINSNISLSLLHLTKLRKHVDIDRKLFRFSWANFDYLCILTFMNDLRKFSEKQLYRIGFAMHKFVYAKTWLTIWMETVRRVVSSIWSDFNTKTIWNEKKWKEKCKFKSVPLFSRK